MNQTLHKIKVVQKKNIVYPRNERLVQYLKINKIIYYTNRRRKTHMIISIDAEITFDKTQYLLLIKNQTNKQKPLSKLAVEENFFNLVKGI